MIGSFCKYLSDFQLSVKSFQYPNSYIKTVTILKFYNH